MWGMEKVLSFLVAGAILIGCYLQPFEGVFLPVALLLLVPLALIWFGGEVGSWAGPSGKRWLGTTRPTLHVKIVGWVLLALLPLVPLGLALFSR